MTTTTYCGDPERSRLVERGRHPKSLAPTSPATTANDTAEGTSNRETPIAAEGSSLDASPVQILTNAQARKTTTPQVATTNNQPAMPRTYAPALVSVMRDQLCPTLPGGRGGQSLQPRRHSRPPGWGRCRVRIITT